MSPPIRDGSGSSIGSIRLGDGSEISEVRTGAGDVLSSGNVLPAAGLLHNFDPRKLSLADGDSVPSRTNQETTGDDLSATSSPTYRTNGINGNPIVEYDGTNDFHQGTFAATISAPLEIFHVFQARSIVQSNRYYDGESTTMQWLVTGSGWQLFDGPNTLTASSNEDTNPHIGVARFATNGEIQLESTLEGSGSDLSNFSLGGLTIGAEKNSTNHAPIDSGQFLIYDASASGFSRADVVSYLSAEWGPF